MIYSKALFYDLIVLLLKGQFYEIMYAFTRCCGGPLYGPVDRQETCNQGNRFYIECPMFEKS
jgi:hypothetical protein